LACLANLSGVDHLLIVARPWRFLGDIEMDNSFLVMSDDDQGIEKTNRYRCNNEHVDRRNVSQEVVQKRLEKRALLYSAD
jgi:hypothetical protein